MLCFYDYSFSVKRCLWGFQLSCEVELQILLLLPLHSWDLLVLKKMCYRLSDAGGHGRKNSLQLRNLRPAY